MLIKELCNLDGVSGNEGVVREFILNAIKPYTDDITIDTMGNIIAYKKGTVQGKKVMMSSHMDEVGLIVSGFTEKGFIEFKTVGGIDTKVLISKKVRIGDVRGIIGMKAIHLQKKSERENVPQIKDIYIDIGAKDKNDAMSKVKLGDYIAFDTEFGEIGTDCIKSKALDDRIGCAILIEALKVECKFDRYVCFFVQEEVGLRGATIATNRIRPDIALVLECTTCSDVPGCEKHEYVTRMGEGVAVTFVDRSTIVDKTYYEWLYNNAKQFKIPVQYKHSTMGGNDAGAIHKSGSGVKTACLSVPCRYMHSPVSIASKTDIHAMRDVALMFINRVGELI